MQADNNSNVQNMPNLRLESRSRSPVQGLRHQCTTCSGRNTIAPGARYKVGIMGSWQFGDSLQVRGPFLDFDWLIFASGNFIWYWYVMVG